MSLYMKADCKFKNNRQAGFTLVEIVVVAVVVYGKEMM